MACRQRDAEHVRRLRSNRHPGYRDALCIDDLHRECHHRTQRHQRQLVCLFFSSRRRHTRCSRDWSSDVCSSDLEESEPLLPAPRPPWPIFSSDSSSQPFRHPRRARRGRRTIPILFLDRLSQKCRKPKAASRRRRMPRPVSQDDFPVPFVRFLLLYLDQGEDDAEEIQRPDRKRNSGRRHRCGGRGRAHLRGFCRCAARGVSLDSRDVRGHAQGRSGAPRPADYHVSAALRRTHSADSPREDRKSTRLNSSHGYISYAVFCLKKKNTRAKLSSFANRVFSQSFLANPILYCSIESFNGARSVYPRVYTSNTRFCPNTAASPGIT